MANSQEYGLFQMLDLGLLNPTSLTRTGDTESIQSAIAYDQAQHNADINAMLRLFCVDTTEFQEEVEQQGASRNQPLDEFGRAIPVKPVAPYTVAYPIQGSGSAWGANYVTRFQMTNRDLARVLARQFRGDFIWVRDHILNAVFTNTSYSFRDPTGKGSLTIQGPANGDSTTYYSSTTGAVATDTHFLAQSSAIADATNPFPTIKNELLEHPANGGEVISFVASDLVSTASALTEFRSATVDPDVTLSSTTTRLTGAFNGVLPPGAMVKGKTDSGVWIVEWPAIPSTYIISITTEGERPLARRQFDVPELQGFNVIGERQDVPYTEEHRARWEGFGARNRLGVVVTRIGNASYSAPAGYGGFMP